MDFPTGDPEKSTLVINSWFVEENKQKLPNQTAL